MLLFTPDIFLTCAYSVNCPLKGFKVVKTSGNVHMFQKCHQFVIFVFCVSGSHSQVCERAHKRTTHWNTSGMTQQSCKIGIFLRVIQWHTSLKGSRGLFYHAHFGFSSFYRAFWIIFQIIVWSLCFQLISPVLFSQDICTVIIRLSWLNSVAAGVHNHWPRLFH